MTTTKLSHLLKISGMTATKLNDLLKMPGMSVVKLDDLLKLPGMTVTKLDDLLSLVDKNLVKLEKFMKDMPLSESDDFLRRVGIKKFKILLNRFNADVLRHYSASFFENYKGVTRYTIDHLLRSDGIRRGEIKGCHDAAMFLNELVIQGRGQILLSTPHPSHPSIINHEYKLFVRDRTGSVVRPPTLKTGHPSVKTVLQNLASDADTWKALANEAADDAIRCKTFPSSGGRFYGKTSSGLEIEGWYRGGSIETFYPIW